MSAADAGLLREVESALIETVPVPVKFHFGIVMSHTVFG